MTLWYVYTINDQEVDKELQLSRTECIELQRNIAELQLKWWGNCREVTVTPRGCSKPHPSACRMITWSTIHIQNTQLHQLRGKMNKMGQVEMSASTMSLWVKLLKPHYMYYMHTVLHVLWNLIYMVFINFVQLQNFSCEINTQVCIYNDR